MTYIFRTFPYILIALGICLATARWLLNLADPLNPMSVIWYGLSVGIVLIGSTVIFWKAQKPYKIWKAWVSFLCILISIRFIWYLISAPVLNKHPMFKDRFGYSGHESYFDWYLTFGLLFLFIGYISWQFPRRAVIFIWKNQSLITKIIWMVCLIWLSVWITEIFLWVSQAWFQNTGETFLYYQLLDLPILGLYTCLAGTLFLIHHFLLQISQCISIPSKIRIITIFTVSLIWAAIHISLFKFWPFSLAMIIIWVVQFGLNWKTSLRQISLQTFFYVVFFAAILAMMFSWHAAVLYQKNQLQLRQYLIEEGLKEGQPDLEAQLTDWQSQWRQDSTIREAVQQNFLTSERLYTHLSQQYIQNHDSAATFLIQQNVPAEQSRIFYQAPSFWIPLAGKWWVQYTPGRILPSLRVILQKVHQHSVHSFDSFYFAMWDNNSKKMVETKGLFPFFDPSFLKLLKGKPTQSFSYKGYAVQTVPVDANIRWIIATTLWDRWDQLASFGGLFMLSIFQIVLIFLILWLLLRSKFIQHIGFSSRIQLFIQIAFLIPLFLLTFILYRLFDQGLAETQSDSQIQVSQNIALGIQKSFQLWGDGKISLGRLEEDFQGISANREQPMALLDLHGKVIIQNRLRETSLIDVWSEKPVLREEVLSDGSRTTAVLYPLITRFNQPLGWLKLSFPEAPLQLDMRKRYLLRSIFMMFLSLFVLLLTTAFFMSNFLTEPLNLLGHRLLGLSLERPNDRLPEDLPDEMGTLTRAYNQMLAKLEESKRALAQSEKQSAWQEVAKQVAHEIKNPLTPMKLQIQQMIRQIPLDSEISSDLKMKSALTKMIDKIDHLSDIAFSFSQFADLAIPQIIRFDLIDFLLQYQRRSSATLDLPVSARKSRIWILQDPAFVEKTLQQIEVFLSEIQTTNFPVLITVHTSDYFAQIRVIRGGFDLTEEEKDKLFFPKITENSSQFGLAMAKKGIESSGGNLWFDQIPGQTNIFYVEIPLG